MNRASQVPWPRILAEGSAIVVSILLAFAIDAWWEERREADESAAQLESLRIEFEEASDRLVKQLGWLRESLEGTLDVIELMGPDAGEAEIVRARPAIGKSLNIGIAVPQYGTLQQVLAAPGGVTVDDSELGNLLIAWPTAMDNLRQDSDNLERNREENYVDALIRLDLPMLGLFDFSPETDARADRRVLLPASNFDVDLSALLRDPGVETIFAMRALRIRILIDSHERSIAAADEIIERLGEAI